jgi:cell division protein FtsB
MPEKLPARRLALIGAVGVLFYLLVLSQYGFLRRWELVRERNAIQAMIASEEQRRLELEARHGELEDDAALERIAREEHGMVRAGEHVYRLAAPDSSRRRGEKR